MGPGVWAGTSFGRTALCMGVVSSLIIAACTALFREQIVHIYNDDPAVTALAMSLLLLGSCYQLVDALQTISIGILRAYNDTRIISLVCFTSYWIIGLPLGFTLARTDWLVPAMGPAGFWISYIVALGFVGPVLPDTRAPSARSGCRSRTAAHPSADALKGPAAPCRGAFFLSVCHAAMVIPAARKIIEI